MKPNPPPSWRRVTVPAGRPSLSAAPAPAGSSVTEAGMFATAQCQNPDAVGASGSNTVPTKLFVSAGKPDHESRSEEQTSERQSLMRSSSAVFCLQQQNYPIRSNTLPANSNTTQP